MFDSLVKFLLLCVRVFNLYLLSIVYAGLGSGKSHRTTSFLSFIHLTYTKTEQHCIKHLHEYTIMCNQS